MRPAIAVAVPRRRARLGWLLALLALALLAGLGWRGWQLYLAGQALRADMAALAGLAAGPAEPAALAQAPALLGRLHRDADALRAQAGPLLPLAQRLGWSPWYGRELAAAEPLLGLLADSAQAADLACAALCPLAGGSPPLSGPRLAAQLAEARPQLQAALAALERAAAAEPALRDAGLAPWLSQPLARLAGGLPQARLAIGLALAAPELLGADGPRSYLLLAQDANELRATGGFIGGAGLLTLDHGRVASLALGDSYAVDDLAGRAYPAPPEPLRRYLGLELWLFRDANWSPDFPTAARKAIEFYQAGQGRAVDGVIAFDERAIVLLLGALGPVQVAGAPAPISAERVVAYMHAQYSRAFPAGRKAFMQPLGQAIVAKLADPAAQIDLRGLAQALGRAFGERHIQAFVRQPAAAELLAQLGWDGAVRPGAHDFLMLVDSNLGYNKVNPNIAESAEYRVDLSDPRAPAAELRVLHQNRQPAAADCRWLARDKVARYEDYFAGCYWDYLRALVPADSRLLGAQTNPTPGAWLHAGQPEAGAAALEPSDGGAVALSTLVVVPAGADRTTTLRYRLPAGVLERTAAGWRYRLRIQRQAAGNLAALAVRLTLPAGARLISAAPAPAAGAPLSFALRLDRDQALDILFDDPATPAP